MTLFILTLVTVGPLGVIAAFFALGWAWEYIAGCFFSLSYMCGQGDLFKGMLFGALAIGCFSLLKKMWEKAK